MHSSVDASTVILEAIETKLEGREIRGLGGIVSPIEETDVAKCSIFQVYPEPTFVTFTVGDQRIEVPAVAEPVEYEGVFNISAILTLLPSAEYDQKNVSCFSRGHPITKGIFSRLFSKWRTFLEADFCKRY